ncbi:hypothetical protein ISCGN_019670 [Ixodes scapularis]
MKKPGEMCPIAHLTVENGIMITDPDYPATPRSCNPEIDVPVAKLEEKTEGRRILVFFAEKDDALYNVECVLGDGNPKDFHNPGKLYTLHAVVIGAVQPVVHALMQASDVRACETLLTCVRNATVRKFGHMGALGTSTTWTFDYEAAVLIATQNVFGTASGTPKVRSCAFYFAKALNTKRDELALRGLSNSNPLVHDWLRRVRHLPFLPGDFRLDFAADLIAARPSVGPLYSARLQQFAVYMSGFWLSKPNREGRLGRLSTYHPALAEFIQFLQVAQFASQNRIQALLRDLLAVASAPPSEVRARNRKLNEEMALFSSYLVTAVPTYQDVINYIDRVALFGLLVA